MIALPTILLTKDLAIRRTDTFDQMHVDVIDRERFDRKLADKASRRTRTTSEAMDGEGQWSGDLIVIEFPDRAHARAWYESAAYQEILPLRTDNAVGEVILVDGVSGDHRATDVLAG